MAFYNFRGKYKPTYRGMLDNGFRQIPVEILFVIIGSDLTKADICIFLYIWHETYGYKEKIRHYKWQFSYKTIMKYTGISKRQVSRSLAKLEEKGIIHKTLKENNKIEIEIILEHYPRWTISKLGLENAFEYIIKDAQEEKQPEDEEDEILSDDELSKELDTL